jgi:hypothetical protein
MRRSIWLLLCVCLGCHGSEASEAAPTADDPSLPPAAAAPEAEAEPAAEAPVKLDPAKVQAFIAYKAKDTDIQLQAVKTLHEIGAKVEAKKDPGIADGVEMLNAHVEGGKQLGDNQAAARKETGLSEAEVTALSEVAGAVMVRNSPINKQLVEQVPKMEAQLAKVPAEGRAEYENGIKELKAQLATTMAMKEERDKYGDAVVDAMLAKGAELEAEQKRLFDGMEQINKK